jgi:curved DNA-binding protein CbpA
MLVPMTIGMRMRIMPTQWQWQDPRAASHRCTTVLRAQKQPSQQPPKLDFDEDYYAVLETPHTAAPRELKKCYYQMVFRYHPDNKVGPDKELCNRQMMVINAAYEVLKSPIARGEYDRKRRAGMVGGRARVTGDGKRTAAAAATGAGGGTGRGSTTTNTTTTTSTSGRGGAYGGTAKQRATSDISYDDNETTESMVDLLSDLWGEISRGGGRGLLDDLLDFLDEPGASGSGSGSGRGRGSGSGSGVGGGGGGEGDRAVRDAAVTNLQAHLRVLEREKTDLQTRLRKAQGGESVTLLKLAHPCPCFVLLCSPC